MANKIIKLRLFNDENNKMNLSLLDISGDLLIVSQFTLHGNCQKGNRPSFLDAASSEHAKKIYNEFVNYMKNKLNKVQTGIFGAHMVVELINDGPVTFILDSNEK
jgi:D-tyrosyl-tRNA(Tyr) deacylase